MLRVLATATDGAPPVEADGCRGQALAAGRGLLGRPSSCSVVSADEPPIERRCVEPGVDGARCEGGGIEQQARCGERSRATGELRGDDRPRGIRIARLEVEAPQAGPSAGLDERTHTDAGVVADDGEVRHVAPEPRQVTRRGDGPRCDDDDEIGVGPIRIGGGRLEPAGLEVQHVVAEEREVRGEEVGERAGAVEADRSGAGRRGIRSPTALGRCRQCGR